MAAGQEHLRVPRARTHAGRYSIYYNLFPPSVSYHIKRPLLVAAVCVLMGLTVACAARDASVAAVEVVETAAPIATSTIPLAATAAGPSSPAAGAALEENPDRPPMAAPVGVWGSEPPGRGGLATQDSDEPRPEANILHVDLDGDQAVIISGNQADPGQTASGQADDASSGLVPSRGPTFTWHDGDDQRTVWQDTRLTVADIAPEGGLGDPSGPVFWSESNELMALPGGVVLMFDPAWAKGSIDAFIRANNINPSDVEAFDGLANAFKVATDPGLPSLRVANSLAGQDGVTISSPNWWVHQFVE